MIPEITAPILRIEHLSKHYFSGQPVLSDIQLSLAPSELLGLLGASGSGKTTLLRLVAGFEQPNQGEIWLGDQCLAGPNVWVPAEQRLVGVVFQDFALFPHLTVRQNILFGLSQHREGLRPANSHREQRLQQVLELVGLADFAQRYPGELSGGQQQRVALARAIAPTPKLIVLDEPFSNLDAGIRYRLRQDVREILQDAGIAGIFVTHDQEEALSIGDRVAVLHNGHLEQCDRPEALYSRPTSRYVADFVLQANFLPAQAQGSLWQTELGNFPARNASGQAGLLMLRQEDAQLILDPTSPHRVRSHQFLGRDVLYGVQLASGLRLQIRQPYTGTVLTAGNHVRLELQVTELLWFAPERVPTPVAV